MRLLLGTLYIFFRSGCLYVHIKKVLNPEFLTYRIHIQREKHPRGHKRENEEKSIAIFHFGHFARECFAIPKRNWMSCPCSCELCNRLRVGKNKRKYIYVMLFVLMFLLSRNIYVLWKIKERSDCVRVKHISVVCHQVTFAIL